MTGLLERIWLWEFQRQLARVVSDAPSRAEITLQVARYRRIPMPGSDRPAALNRHMATCLLASAEWLECHQNMTRTDALHATATALVQTGRPLFSAMTGLWLRLNPNPFAKLRYHGLARRARKLWGNGVIVEDEISDEQVALVISQCPFTEFFWNAGRPDLIEVIYHWDHVWMAQINRRQMGLRVHRRGTLSDGGETCAFVFEPAPRKSGCPRRTGQPTQTQRPM